MQIDLSRQSLGKGWSRLIGETGVHNQPISFKNLGSGHNLTISGESIKNQQQITL
jgi:hypothetical protein